MRNLEISNDTYRQLAHAISDLTADYLGQLSELPVFPLDAHVDVTESLFGGELPWKGMGQGAFGALDDVLRLGRPASPRYFGHVFGSGDPVAMLGEHVAVAQHQNVTTWQASPAAYTIERTVVRWLAESIGCDGFVGSLTLGGSSANLMALCMAREAGAPANASGYAGGVVYGSTEAHMSVAKSASILGIGLNNVRQITVNQRWQMDVAALRLAIEQDLAAGIVPLAVVASAGTTATGSIDPLDAIADVCREFGVWLHVDGAYGAVAAAVEPELFRGLSRADSVSLDPHKWLYQPTGCGCLVYRDARAARRAFSHSDDYARPLSSDPVEGFAFFEESIELSRPFRALRLWLSIRYHGFDAFRESIAEDMRLARRLADMVDAHPSMSLAAPVALSAVCFWYDDGLGDLDGLNQAIMRQVMRRGRVFISNATLNGRFCLRACIVNHRTTEGDLSSLIDEVDFVARNLARSEDGSGYR